MSDPIAADAPNICRCGRPRSTSTDLAQWQKEIDDFGKAGGDGRYFNPEWARAICWMKPGTVCHMKPIQETT